MALARGRPAKQPEVGTDLPWWLAAHWIVDLDMAKTYKSAYLHSSYEKQQNANIALCDNGLLLGHEGMQNSQLNTKKVWLKSVG